jgi:hypothetical protein
MVCIKAARTTKPHQNGRKDQREPLARHPKHPNPNQTIEGAPRWSAHQAGGHETPTQHHILIVYRFGCFKTRAAINGAAAIAKHVFL